MVLDRKKSFMQPDKKAELNSKIAEAVSNPFTITEDQPRW